MQSLSSVCCRFGVGREQARLVIFNRPLSLSLSLSPECIFLHAIPRDQPLKEPPRCRSGCGTRACQSKTPARRRSPRSPRASWRTESRRSRRAHAPGASKTHFASRAPSRTAASQCSATKAFGAVAGSGQGTSCCLSCLPVNTDRERERESQ